MLIRENTFLVKNKNLEFGNSNKVLIQSMCDIKTSKVKRIIKQINDCAKLGADLMRVSVLDLKDAKAIKTIKENINIPLVCDIHYNYKFAIEAIKNGADKIRLNPGNLQNSKELVEIINYAKKYDTIIRIGLNVGSFINERNNDETKFLIDEALKYIKIFEENDFNKLVISLKTSNPLTTYNTYKEFSKISKYPLHIGLTEAGYGDIGIIKSSATLAPLLLDGIGNTIRISLSDSPLKEIEACKILLHELGLYDNYPTIISCPTCGRTQVKNIRSIAEKVYEYCLKHNKNIKVAVMGCAVNGIGEGKNSDIGIAGSKNSFTLFKKGKVITTLPENEALNALFKEIDNL